MRLKNKVAIITGAGRGIGRATALRFAGEGATVIVADVDLTVAQAVVDEILASRGGQVQTITENLVTGNGGTPHTAETVAISNGVVLPIQVNVTEQESVKAMIGQVMERFGRIDVLVNNAGIVRDARLVTMTEQDFDAVIDVNLKGVFNCAQAVAPIMIEQGSGVILNAASVVAAYGNFGQTNYVGTKAGVVGMTKVWARELGPKGVRVNAVAPGFIRTRMTEGIPEQVIAKITQRIPMQRMGNPEDIANAYLWLASDEAAYVNGHTLAVDGGVVV